MLALKRWTVMVAGPDGAKATGALLWTRRRAVAKARRLNDNQFGVRYFARRFRLVGGEFRVP